MCAYPFSYSLLITFRPVVPIYAMRKMRTMKENLTKENEAVLTSLRGHLQNFLRSYQLSENPQKGDLLKMFNCGKTYS